MAQPRQLCVALNADSFCAALKKLSFGKEVLHQTFGVSILLERGGTEEPELGKLEEGSLDWLKEA